MSLSFLYETAWQILICITVIIITKQPRKNLRLLEKQQFSLT